MYLRFREIQFAWGEPCASAHGWLQHGWLQHGWLQRKTYPCPYGHGSVALLHASAPRRPCGLTFEEALGVLFWDVHGNAGGGTVGGELYAA